MERHITDRLVIHVGFSCNERCRFCYYRESLESEKVKDLTLNEVKHRLDIGRRFGKTKVDLSGGEPTIRKDISDIIRYAKAIGYKTICIITNGIRVSDYAFFKYLVDAGLNDVLFSIHGADKKMHDYLTRVPGSWEKIIKAVGHAQKLGINVRINTVINNANYSQMDNYFNLMGKLKPNVINLLVFNPAEEVVRYREDDVSIADYEGIGAKISEALKKYGHKHSTINVRFMPFCLIKGHERNVRTLWQIQYEREEWDPLLFIRFRKGFAYVPLFTAIGFILSILSPLYYHLPFSGKKDKYTFCCELIRAAHIFHNYKHVKRCKKCSLHEICPGLNRAYVKKFNMTTVYPYGGKVIEDPLYFCHDIIKK